MKNDSNEFWDSARVSATIKFGAWIVFIVVIIVLFSVTNKNNREKEESKEVYNFKTFEEMQGKLLEHKYDYTFKIKIKDLEYVYSGTRCNDEDHGFKETKDEIIKYLITENEVYKIILEEFDTINTIYEEINRKYVDVDMLFDGLKNYNYNVEKNKDSRVISYNDTSYKVDITTDLESIKKIDIVDNGDEYHLEFTNTNKCDSISLEKN